MRRLSEHQLANDLFFRACPAGVHSVDPAKLIAGFEDFGDAFGFGELGGDEVDLLIGLTADVDEVLSQGVLHQHQRECIGLMFLKKLLSHTSKTADIPGRLGRKCKVGIVIVSVFGVSDVHCKFSFRCNHDPMNSFTASAAFTSRPVIIPARSGTAIKMLPTVNS